MIVKLIAAGADIMAPDKMGWTPLHCAVSNGEANACKTLTKSGADPQRKDSEGKSAMDLAKHFGNSTVIGILDAAVERDELEELKNLGIGSGSHRGAKPMAPIAVA